MLKKILGKLRNKFFANKGSVDAEAAPGSAEQYDLTGEDDSGDDVKAVIPEEQEALRIFGDEDDESESSESGETAPGGDGEGGDLSDEDMDAEIQKLMQQMDEAGVGVKVAADAAPQAAEETSAELMREGEGGVWPNLNDISKKTYIIVIGVMALLLVVSVVFLMLSIAALKEHERRVKLPAAAAGEIPKHVANNASYIYPKDKGRNDMVRSIGALELRLVKLVSDELMTAFYFDKEFDIDKYNISLTDIDGVGYVQDRTFSLSASGKEPKTVLRFEPLAEGVSGFSLRLQDIESGENTEFNLMLDKPIEYPPARYLSERMEFYSTDDDMSIFIESAKFSSSGSIIDYSVRWGNDIDSVYFQSDKDCLKLKDVYGTVMPARQEPVHYIYEEENMLLGRMDYSAVYNLNGAVELTFDNLHKLYDLNIEVPAEELFDGGSHKPKTIKAGKYDIVLERFGMQSSYYVLVLHTKDSEYAGKVSADGKEDRVENRLIVRLVITSRSGEEYVIEGDVKTKQAGSDILFDVGGIIEYVGGASYSSMRLEIDSACIKIPAQTFKMTLSKLKWEENEEKAGALDAVVKAFDSRLAYKAADIETDGIEGFSADIIKDKVMMKIYTGPEPDYASYSSRVAVSSFDTEDGRLYAVVTESWVGGFGDNEVHFYRVHKIAAGRNNEGVVIYQDELISAPLS